MRVVVLLLVLCVPVMGQEPIPCPHPERVEDTWRRFICQWNDSEATRRHAQAQNRLTEATKLFAQYQAGKVVGVGDEKKQVKDQMAAALAEIIRLCDGVKAEAEALLKTLGEVK